MKLLTFYQSVGARSVLSCVGILAYLCSAHSFANKAQMGEWGDVIHWTPHIPSSIANLPDGRILSWNSRDPDEATGAQHEWGFTLSAIYDPVSGQFQVANNTVHGMFCPGISLLEDGSVLVSGGVPDTKESSLFNVDDMSWREMPEMKAARYYPTAVTMPDNNVFLSHARSAGNTSEVYDSANNSWEFTPNASQQTLVNELHQIAAGRVPGNRASGVQWYAHLSVAPSGKVLHAGPTQSWHFFDPMGGANNSPLGKLTGERARIYGNLVNYDAGKVLLVGGHDPSKAQPVSADNVYLVDMNGAVPSVTKGPAMRFARTYANSVVMPNGEIIVIGGQTDGANYSTVGTRLTPEIYSPSTNSWRLAANIAVPRIYHSTAILMKDGRVMSAGGGVCGNRCPSATANQQNAQIYSPGYLFNNDGSLRTRPTINSAPSQTTAGSTLSVNASDNVTKFNLLRLSGTTHHINADQRLLPLTISNSNGGSYDVRLPANPNVLLPGYYWLFALDDRGTPSIGYTIQVVRTSAGNNTVVTLGDASVVDVQTGEYQLTPNDNGQLGAIGSVEELNLAEDFTLKAKLNFGDNDNNGADGLTFTLHADSRGSQAISASNGPGLGAWGINNGLAFEFDTYANGGTIADPASDHFSAWDTDTGVVTIEGSPTTQAMQQVIAPVALSNIEDGNWHDFEVNWQVASKTLTVKLNGQQLGTVNADIAKNYFADSQYVHFAFTAATGGFSNKHSVKELNVITGNKFVTLGGATVASDNSEEYQLTADTNTQLGAVASVQPLDLTKNANVKAKIYLGNKDANGADGLTFTLHADSRGHQAISSTYGPGLGTWGINNGLAFEFDTYTNGGTIADPAADHFAAWDTDTGVVTSEGNPSTQAMQQVIAPVGLDNIEDDRWHDFELNWQVSSKTLTVKLDGQVLGNITADVVNDYFGDNQSVHYLFTATTGGLSNKQSVKNIVVVNQDSVQPQPQPSKITYTNQDLTLIGDSTNVSNEVVQLTVDRNAQLGAVATSQAVDLSHDFSLVTELYLGNKDVNGADGIAITLHADPRGASAISNVGGTGLGAWGVANGLAFEFDTYANFGNIGDPTQDHFSAWDTDTGVVTDVGAPRTAVMQQVIAPVLLGNIEDGQWHNVKFTWRAASQRLTVSFDNRVVGEVSGDLAARYFGGANSVYITTTGSTGGLSNTQQLRNFVLESFVGSSLPVGDIDSDGDGVKDSEDAFPHDPSESADADGDGVGDNSDAFPNDASESVDTDGDGIGDNADPFPNDANRYGNITPLPNKPLQSSSLIVVQENGSDQIWNVNPDNNSVSVSSSDGRLLTEIAVGEQPWALIQGSYNNIYVTNKASSTLTIIDPSRLAVVRTVSLLTDAQPHGIVFNPTRTHYYVALEALGIIVKMNTSNEMMQVLDVPGKPRHLTMTPDGAKLLISNFVTPLAPGEDTENIDVNQAFAQVFVASPVTMTLMNTINIPYDQTPVGESIGPGLPNYLGAPAVSFDSTRAYVPSKKDNIDSGQLRAKPGMSFDQAVRAHTSSINLQTNQVNVGIDHDNASVATGAAFSGDSRYLLITLETSRELVVYDTQLGFELMRLDTGRAPQSVALSSDSKVAYVHNFMDRSISRFNLAEAFARELAIEDVLPSINVVSREALMPQILLGKQFFYDAADTRLARDGYMSCASCHKEGKDDGRVWDFTQFGEGLRNTTSLLGKAGTGHGRLHWTGNFDEIQDFEGQIRNFAGGTGLMSDSDFNQGTRNQPLGDRKTGISSDLDALAAYITSLSKSEVTPYSQSSSSEQGKQLFSQYSCASCHAGRQATDSVLNQRHDIGTIKSASGKRDSVTLDGFDTPSLLGVWSSAPYLHDGSANTIERAILAHTNLSVTEDEAKALADYVKVIKPTDLQPLVRNVAAGKQASQSSTYINGGAAQAVDGNTDGAYNNLSISHTDLEQSPWWQVDLSASYNIDTINLWNRTDCCIERLANFYVLVSDTPFASDDLQQLLNQSGVKAMYYANVSDVKTVVNVNQSGRYIRVQIAGQGVLSIAELEVMGSSK